MTNVPMVTNIQADSPKAGRLRVNFDAPSTPGKYKYVVGAKNLETGEFKYKRFYEKTQCVFKRLDKGCNYEVKIQTRVRNPQATPGVLSNENFLRSEWAELNQAVMIAGNKAENKSKQPLKTRLHLIVSEGDKVPPYAIGDPFYVRRDPESGKWVEWPNPVDDKVVEYVEKRIGYYEEGHDELLEQIADMEAALADAKAQGNSADAARLTHIIGLMEQGVPASEASVKKHRVQLEAQARAIYEAAYPMPIKNPEQTLNCGVYVPAQLTEVAE